MAKYHRGRNVGRDHQWISGAHGVTEKVVYITYVDQLDAYYESTRGNLSMAFFSQ